MAKVIKYCRCKVVQRSMEKPRTDEDSTPEYESWTEEVFSKVKLPWSEANETLAKREAYNGEYTVEDDDVEKPVSERIRELKKALSATDYKVIKCAECQLLGMELPYDLEALHTRRQAIRDEINRLEGSV